MNIKLFAKIGIIMGSVLVGAFVLFLALPLVINLAIDKFTPQIVGEINKATGLSAGLEEIRLVTTPKMTAGLKVKKFELYTPKKEPVIIADNFQVKMSLLPILAKNIRVDVIRLSNAEITLKINKDGSFDVEQYLPKEENTPVQENDDQEPFVLPFGLKLSNHLPDIHIGAYKATITDGTDNYVLAGGKTDITDFVINKSVRIKGDGHFALKGREQFKYDIKLFNKIMPNTELNDLVFNPVVEENKQEPEKVDIMGILKGMYDYKLTGNVVADLKTDVNNINGFVKVNNVSLIDLTPSNADLTFKGNTINLDSNLYTAQNEVSNLTGKITTGKKPYLDMKFKSDVELANVLNIVKKVALIFNIKDLQTLTANGGMKADFNIKSDTKTVQSSGYLKVPSAKVFYGLYNIGIDNINADINLDNNNVNIKNIAFSVLGQPLKLYGTITENAESDLHLIASKLNLKGLLVACGQAAIMKENPIYSGDVSMDVSIKGKLDKINPVAKINIANVDLKNIPSDIRLKAPSTVVDITSDGVTFGGEAHSSNISLINPALTITVPKLKANIKESEIVIPQPPVKIEKINTNAAGKITNYLTEKIGLNFVTTGDIKSTLTGDMNVSKQTLNLSYATTDLSSIIIPLFDKSKMTFTGKIGITGSMMNPIVSGNMSIPEVTIPEIPVKMTDMDVKLHGTILHGSATVRTFENGGIKAENIVSDFELKGNEFYLNNLKGGAFDGKINGNIIYNLANAKTSVDFSGTGMNAEKAAEGAIGIKNALSGTMGFNAKLKLVVYPDFNQMMKSIKGDVDFNIKKGAFGTIGRFESFLGASNIINNVLLKNTVAAISNATGLATTAQFDSLEGVLTLADGWTDLKPIKSAGKSLCYYITGKYNIINGTTNVAILGRLDAPMVAKLGPIGDLSANKLFGYIPKFGNATANIINALTTNPAGEKISEIPALTNGSTNYKDFKVSFNGGIDSKSSIKSFKWLSQPDLSELEPKSISDTIDDIKSSFNTDIKENIDKYNNAINQQKQNIKDTKENIKNSAEEIKNLFKSFKDQVKGSQTQNSGSSTTEATSTTTQSNTATQSSTSAQTSSGSSAASSTSTQSTTSSSTQTSAPAETSTSSSTQAPAQTSTSTVTETSAPVQTTSSSAAQTPSSTSASSTSSESTSSPAESPAESSSASEPAGE